MLHISFIFFEINLVENIKSTRIQIFESSDNNDQALCYLWQEIKVVRNNILYSLKLRSWSFFSPVSLPVDLREVDAAIDDATPASSILEARQADPELIVDHPQQQRREDDNVGEGNILPFLCSHHVQSMQHPWSKYHVLRTYTMFDPYMHEPTKTKNINQEHADVNYLNIYYLNNICSLNNLIKMVLDSLIARFRDVGV